MKNDARDSNDPAPAGRTDDVSPYPWSGNQTIGDQSPIDPKSARAPGMAELGGRLELIYRGVVEDTFYQSTFDGRLWVGDATLPAVNGSNPGSNFAPAVAVLGGTLYAAYKGAHSNNLDLAWYDGTDWHGNEHISNLPGGIDPQSDLNPALAVFDDVLYMAYKGEGSDTLYLAWTDGSSWEGNVRFADLPGGIDPASSQAPALAVREGVLYMVYKGASSNHLYQSTYAGSQWTGNRKISDISGIDPESDVGPALGCIDDQLFLIYKGADKDDLYQAVLGSTGWTGNQKISEISSIDPQSSHPPSLATFGSALYLVYTGSLSPDLYLSVLDLGSR